MKRRGSSDEGVASPTEVSSRCQSTGGLPSAASCPDGGESLTSIRTAIPEDAKAIAGVHVAGWQWAYVGLLPEPLLRAQSVPDRASFWRSYITDPTNWPVFVAADGEDIVGFASAIAARDGDLDDSKVSELAAIYMLEGATGEGLGKALLERCWKESRDRSRDSMVLWVLAENDRARRFYSRHGFEADGTSKHEERLGTNEIRMSASISASR